MIFEGATKMSERSSRLSLAGHNIHEREGLTGLINCIPNLKLCRISIEQDSGSPWTHNQQLQVIKAMQKNASLTHVEFEFEFGTNNAFSTVLAEARATPMRNCDMTKLEEVLNGH